MQYSGLAEVLHLWKTHTCPMRCSSHHAFAGAQVIAPRWLRLFNPAEVNQLLAGGEGGGLDVADMRAHAKYSGGYAPDSPTVRLFWKVRSVNLPY